MTKEASDMAFDAFMEELNKDEQTQIERFKKLIRDKVIDTKIKVNLKTVINILKNAAN